HQQTCADEQSHEVGHDHTVDGIAMRVMRARHAADFEGPSPLSPWLNSTAVRRGHKGLRFASHTWSPGRQEEHRLLLTVGLHQPLSGRSRRAYTPSIEGVSRCGTFASIRPSEVADER